MSDMPIRLTHASIDEDSGRALFRQLADVIRDAIDNGELRPGEVLPSEGEIAATVEMSRTSVRDAMDILAAEGRIMKRKGRPTRVAEPPPVRHMATSRYAEELALLRSGEPHPLTSAFVTDHHVGWDAYRVDADYNDDVAGETEAEQLDVPVGTPILRRHLMKWVANDPVQLQESVMPLDLVQGTPVADPSRQPWPGGTIAELYSLGVEVTRVVEEAFARVPTVAETTALKMAAAAPVFEIVRIFHAGDRPVECSTVVVPAARNILRWETDLS